MNPPDVTPITMRDLEQGENVLRVLQTALLFGELDLNQVLSEFREEFPRMDIGFVQVAIQLASAGHLIAAFHLVKRQEANEARRYRMEIGAAMGLGLDEILAFLSDFAKRSLTAMRRRLEADFPKSTF